MRIDIRGLLAATVIAAFAASTWQVDPGWAVAPTAILAGCGLVRLGRPEGESSLKATVIVAVAGTVALFCGWLTQYLLCGMRLGLLWGTVAFVCGVSLLTAIAVRVPIFASWMKRGLVVASLVLVTAIAVRFYQTRHEQRLMAQHFVDVAYVFPSLGMFDIEPSNTDATPIRVRLRVLMGIAKVHQLIARKPLDAAQWQAASKLDSLMHMNIERTRVDSRDLPEITFHSQPSLMIWDSEFTGDAIGKTLQLTNASTLWLSNTRVESFKGLAQASSLRDVVIHDVPITDELIDELSRLSSLVRIQFYPNATPSDAQLKELTSRHRELVVVCRREQQGSEKEDSEKEIGIEKIGEPK